MTSVILKVDYVICRTYFALRFGDIRGIRTGCCNSPRRPSSSVRVRPSSDPRHHESGRREAVRGGRLPERVRQDEPGDADPDDPGVQGRVRRRRHLLDEVRRGGPAEGDQPRGGLLRRRSRLVSAMCAGPRHLVTITRIAFDTRYSMLALQV